MRKVVIKISQGSVVTQCRCLVPDPIRHLWTD